MIDRYKSLQVCIASKHGKEQVIARSLLLCIRTKHHRPNFKSFDHTIRGICTRAVVIKLDHLPGEQVITGTESIWTL